jgi:hypothetical protein
MKNWQLLVSTVCVSKPHPGRSEKCVGAWGRIRGKRAIPSGACRRIRLCGESRERKPPVNAALNFILRSFIL